MTIPNKHRSDLIAYRTEQAHKAVEDVEFLIQ